MTIATERLDLVPLTPAFLRASLRHDLEEACSLLGVPVPAGWPAGVEDLLAMRLADLEADPALQPWLLRAMVLREGDHGVPEMVGYAGFHTAPGAAYLAAFSPQAAEMGWTVFPPYRRRGYARETALALMQWARQVHRVPAFLLSISPDNFASQALAAQLGFAPIGTHMDEVDGLEEVLELRVAPDAGFGTQAGTRG